MKIRKNDKTLEDFSEARIKSHIRTLAEDIDYDCTKQELDYVISKLQLTELMTSAEIRKQLEVILLGVDRELGSQYIKVFGEKDHKAKDIRRKNDFIDNYIDAINPATGAKYDANANVSSKNVVTLGQELHKSDNIEQNRAMLTEKIAELFSKDLAHQYIEDLTSHVLYKHDETATPGVPYCVAITMYPFLLDGLTKLGGESEAPTNFKSFNGGFINLVYSIASQFAGAVATPEYLMYLDYFIRKDYGEDYSDRLDEIVDLADGGKTLRYVIENGFQQVVHSMNMPSGNRGYQCVREDTTQLSTPNGFKYLNELKEGDLCYVYKDGKLAIEPIQKLNVHDFDGELRQFKGRNYQQTVTENHRVLYKKPNTSEYAVKEAHELWDHSKLSMPIGCNGIDKEDFPITDELLQLCAVTLTDGSIDEHVKGDINTGRITIYKSKKRWGYKEIPELLDAAGIGFTESDINTNSFGEMVSFRIPAVDSQWILRYIEHTKKQLPAFFKELSKRQLDLVIDVWSKTDGQSGKSGTRLLQCDNAEIQEQMQELVLLAGYGSEIYNTIGKKFNGEDFAETKYVKVFKRKDKRVSEYNYIPYAGKVWCPTTEAGIVIFREENGVPYISGNSVFWNVSYFDEPYFKGVFENFLFPDGTPPKWETVSALQKNVHEMV